MSDSVGKISLDIDLKSDLNKQIGLASNNIGEQLSGSIQRQLKGTMNGMKKMMSSFTMPKKSFEMPKKIYTTKAQVKAPEVDMEAAKAQIASLEPVLDNVNAKLDFQRNKLKQLQESFEGTYNEKRKNRLQEQILNTESTILRLTKTSDATVSKIWKLEDALNETGNEAVQASDKIGKLDNNLKRSNKSLNNTEKTVKKTGMALFTTGRRANVMGNQFTAAFKRIAKQILVFAVLYKAIRSFQQYISSALKTNNEFMHSMNQIRTNLQVAFMPIYQAVLPALQAMARALATVTAYIASFISAIFGKTYKQSFQAAKGLNAAKSAMEGYGSASKKAAKEAKKASLGLAGFDEINSLSDSDADGGADDGAGGGGGAGDVGGLLIEPDIDTGLIDSKMAELVGGIKTLLEPVTNSLKNLWTAMDPFKAFVAQGVVDFYNNFLKPLGSWVIGEGLPRLIDALAIGFQAVNWGIINDGLNRLWEVLTPFAINVGEGLLWLWENVLVPLGTWTMSKVVPTFLDILSGAIKVVNNTIDALKPLGKWLFDNFLEPIAEFTGGVIVSVLKSLGSALKVIGKWIEDNQKGVESFTVALGSFALAWGLVTLAVGAWSIVAGISTGVTTLFGAAIAFLTSPITIAVAIIGTLIAIGVLLYKNWDAISGFLKVIWIAIKLVVTEVFNSIKTTISDVWDSVNNVTKNLWNTLVTFLTTLWNGMKVAVGIVFIAIKNSIVNAFTAAKNSISAIWNSITSIITGVWNGIKLMASSVFTGIKNGIIEAFENVKLRVTSIWEGIWGMIKGFINNIISGVNAMIRGLNKLSFSAPDWVPVIGGKSFGVSIPEIPKLARGGIIDQPTLAMVGEAGKEAVMPLENNTGWINNLAGQIAGQMGGSGGELQSQGIIEVLFMILSAIERQNQSGPEPTWNLDGTTFARLIGPYLQAELERMGSSLIQPI